MASLEMNYRASTKSHSNTIAVAASDFCEFDINDVLRAKLGNTQMNHGTLLLTEPMRSQSDQFETTKAQLVWHPRLGLVILVAVEGRPHRVDQAVSEAVTRLRRAAGIVELNLRKHLGRPTAQLPISVALVFTQLNLSELGWLEVPSDVAILERSEIPQLMSHLRRLMKQTYLSRPNARLEIPGLIAEIRTFAALLEWNDWVVPAVVPEWVVKAS